MHGSCVAIEGKAVVIAGRSGSGKSALALELMSRGAELVADDQVILRDQDDQLFARAPEALRDKIEARFVGLLRAESVSDVVVQLWVDLDHAERDRLPQQHTIKCLGVKLPLLFAVSSPHFASAILQYLKHGRYA
ncbi:HPr kinase/phosphorylase [Cognatishimia activa]|uniref:HPr kinase/phosphorylase n=1 Tax=Cognatishimia activa TaxID=1715691 RepID=A0A0P1J3J9_9RHOB|nr:HPr kinase/phosphatase C-terminal domain-containing protein [Cognatishimia activa]MEE2945296.1 HPr kinase/phosphatase C-terminal domain-containing protein [Pseudomonadota bacterium]CUI48507.1 HPr kinase/phosphorylase [Cognatishimia activa]CUK27410.1 HPr kinase/phosphorylase [Cognatishimia activa]